MLYNARIKYFEIETLWKGKEKQIELYGILPVKKLEQLYSKRFLIG
jgi:hypothetical protein